MQIESGIPIPPKCANTKPFCETVRSLQVGQSLLCNTERLARIARAALIRAGRKCTWRKVDGGWRLWRTS